MVPLHNSMRTTRTVYSSLSPSDITPPVEIYLSVIMCPSYTQNKHRLTSNRNKLWVIRKSWFPGEDLAEHGNQETSRWDAAGHANNHTYITFPTRKFTRNLFRTKHSVCFQMLCYSRCVHHLCFGLNGPYHSLAVKWAMVTKYV